jgi:hypothetical protein
MTANRDYSHIAGIVDNVLEINLKKQQTIELLVAPVSVPWSRMSFDEANNSVWNDYKAKNCLTGEYYMNKNTLVVIVNLWDTEQKRIKDTFVKSMPNDLDMLSNLELMAREVADNIGRVLPALEREAFIAKQVNADIREQVDSEERILDRIFSNGNELQFAPGTGFNMGRTAISFSSKGCLISPSLNIEYSYLFRNNLHLRLGVEYLPFHVMDTALPVSEASAELLFGFHTMSLATLSLDLGAAVIFDRNGDSTALSYYKYKGSDPFVVTRSVERVSISIPVQIGFYMYTGSPFFFNIRLRYHGLTWTIEPLEYGSYEAGSQSLKYAYGFSPWTLFFVSIALQGGFRF